MALNWNSVKKDNVERACQMMLAGKVRARLPVKGLFVRYRDELLPAKHVMRVAYCLANGLSVSSKLRFSSGEATIQRLRSLGFEAGRGSAADK